MKTPLGTATPMDIVTGRADPQRVFLMVTTLAPLAVGATSSCPTPHGVHSYAAGRGQRAGLTRSGRAEPRITKIACDAEGSDDCRRLTQMRLAAALSHQTLGAERRARLAPWALTRSRPNALRRRQRAEAPLMLTANRRAGRPRSLRALLNLGQRRALLNLQIRPTSPYTALEGV